MTTITRLSEYLLVFVILFAGFVATGVWHRLDYFVYRTLYLDASRNIQLAENILLIDLPYLSNDNNNDPTEYRLRLADLLGVMAASERERPQAVILDIWISNDSRGLAELTEAIKRLRERPAGPVDVYAAFNPHADGKEGAEQLWKEHAQDLYRSVLTGYGHTELDLSMGVLSYEPELQIPAKAGTTELMWALPARVAMDMGRSDRPAGGRAVVLPIGSEAALGQQTIAFMHAGTSTSSGRFLASRAATAPVAPNVRQEDRADRKPHRGSLQRSTSGGPELDRMGTERSIEEQQHVEATAEQSRRGARPDHVLRLVHRVRVRSAVQIRHAPANQASADGLAVRSASAPRRWQWSRQPHSRSTTSRRSRSPLFAIVLAAILAWRFALKFLVTGIAEGRGKYDAFISYSRQHSEWVMKHVYEPLKAMRKADGSELAVFFDRTEIGLGEAFTTRYMWAIVDSRFFIPIFSEDYYGRKHTRNEMDMAYKRSVEKKIVILPVAHTAQPVPEIYSHLNYVDAQANPRFIEDIQKSLLGVLSPEP